MRIARLTCAVLAGAARGPLSIVTFDGNAWSAPYPVAGSSLATPPALARFGETLYCLHQDANGTGRLVALSCEGRWGDETVVAEQALVAAPAAAVLAGRLYAVHQSYGNTRALAYESTADGSHWTARTTAPTPPHVAGSTAAATFGGALYVFYNQVVMPANAIAYVTLSGSGSWGTEQLVPGGSAPVAGTPGAAVFRERLYVCFPNGSKVLCAASYDGNRWEAAQPVPGATGIAGGVSVVAFEGLLYALYRSGIAGIGALLYMTFDGAAWRGPQQAGSFTIAVDPAATVF